MDAKVDQVIAKGVMYDKTNNGELVDHKFHDTQPVPSFRDIGNQKFAIILVILRNISLQFVVPNVIILPTDIRRAQTGQGRPKAQAIPD